MPQKDEVFNKNTNQMPANEQDRRYNGDARGWVRGAPDKSEPAGKNETGMGYPNGGFDRGNSWRRKDKGHGLT